jgi:hypothetical protein
MFMCNRYIDYNVKITSLEIVNVLIHVEAEFTMSGKLTQFSSEIVKKMWQFIGFCFSLHFNLIKFTRSKQKFPVF